MVARSILPSRSALAVGVLAASLYPLIAWQRYGSGIAATQAVLPAMIRDDPCTRVIDKAGGAAAFEEALGWALSDTDLPDRNER